MGPPSHLVCQSLGMIIWCQYRGQVDWAYMAGTVIVIGAGIIGAGTAFRLAQQGWQVTVLSQGIPAATSASFGWINASFYLDDDHHRLRVEGIAAWHQLVSETDIAVDWSGCLCWDMGPDELTTTYETLVGHGYPVTRLTHRQIAERVPALRNPPKTALFFPNEGAAASPDIPERLLAAAESLGVRHLKNVLVEKVEYAEDGRPEVLTSQGVFVADQIVIAAGTGTQALAKALGARVPLSHRPAYILRTTPVAPMLPHVLASPIGEIRQEPSGHLLMPTAVGHQGDASDRLSETPAEAASAAMGRLRGVLSGLDDVRWSEVTYAERPVPEDGFPVLGYVADRVYAACLHSGITLGPIVAELVASEISGKLDNAKAAMLAPYRPDRFQKTE